MVFSGVDPRADAGWQRHQGTSTSEFDIGDLPEGYRAVAVDTESAAELRDLASLRRDLELASVYAKAFCDQVPEANEEINTREPFYGLWFAALICYGRCFGSGVRHVGKVAIDGLEKEEFEGHKYLLALRDKHIAHAVNGYEDTAVFAILTDSSFMSRQVTRTGQVHAEIADDPIAKAAILLELCAKHLAQLTRRIWDLHRAIGRELYMMGPDAVYALPPVKLRRDAKIDKPRKISSKKRAKPPRT